jgi:putative DNA primase/helicase
MHMLMTLKGWHFGQAAKAVDEFLPQAKVEQAKAERTEESKRAYMKRLYLESRPVAPGDPVSLYLARRCGDVAGQLGDIRFHPELKHSVAGTTHPAMLAFMGWNPATKKFGGIHRTYLTPDGRKAALDPVRMAYGDAGAVRLGPIRERMGIAEGIETALCAGQLFTLPVWSGISANGMLAWVPPEGVREVVIFGDNDANYVGIAAAYELARALAVKGYVVDVRIPPEIGQDWADVWAARGQLQGVA